MRAVRSLIQNHRHSTATEAAAARPLTHPTLAENSWRLAAQPHGHNTRIWAKLTVSCPLLTVCRDSPSVAVTATVRPLYGTLRCPHTNVLLPREVVVQSQIENADWLLV